MIDYQKLRDRLHSYDDALWSVKEVDQLVNAVKEQLLEDKKSHPLDDHSQWSQETFKNESPADMLLHLEDELLEFRKEFIHRTPRMAEELVDLIFMVNSIGLALGSNLKQVMEQKMKKNKSRIWENNRHLKCEGCGNDLVKGELFELWEEGYVCEDCAATSRMHCK